VSYLITMGAVTQIVGSLSDRIGRRRMYLSGIAAFGAASLACGLAPHIVLLDLARAVQGIGGAVLMVNALPLLAHRYEGEQRNLAIATWGSASTAASLVAPLLGGLLVDGLGWRSMFLVNVPLCAAAFVVAVRVLPADRAGVRRGRLDWTGTALLAAALAVIGVALLRGERQGWGSAATVTQLAAGVVFFAAFVLVERRAAAPVLDLALFRRSAFTGAALAVFMSRVLSIGGTVYFVQYLQGSLQLGATAAGLLLVPVFVAQMGAGLLGGKLLSRFHPGHVIASGYLAKALGAAGIAVAAGVGAAPLVLVVPLLVWGAGGGIAGAPVMAVAMNVTDKSHAGMVAGMISGLASIGAGIGTAALGAVYGMWAGAQPSPNSIAAATAVVLSCSAVLAVLTGAAVLAMINRRALIAASGSRGVAPNPRPLR
jgi:MFS family permease